MGIQTEVVRSPSGEPQKALAVPRGFQSPKPGDLYLCNTGVIRIVRLDSLESASVINVATGKSGVVSLAELRPLADVVHEITESQETEPLVANDRIDPTGTRHKRVSRWVKHLTRSNPSHTERTRQESGNPLLICTES